MDKDIYREDSSASDDLDNVEGYINYENCLENNVPILKISLDLRDINFYASQQYELGN